MDPLGRDYDMPSAEVIAIGTELLLGETLDTNTQVIARALREIGVDLYRTSTVGDNEERIAESIRWSSARTDIVITTGGLGPTVDDPTREAVARALGRELTFDPELWHQIRAYYDRFDKEPTQNNRRQAYLPAHALALPNPRGTAPGFFLDMDQTLIFCLPGVPPEMTGMLHEQVIPCLESRFPDREMILVRTISTREIGESEVDERISDLEKYSNPTVGLAAQRDGVQVRITAKGSSRKDVEKMLAELEAEIRDRLGKWIREE